jgi:two-component system, NarL family, response regulator NreC
VVVMDLSMPVMDGIEACRQITARLQRTKVVGLSIHSDRRFIDGMMKAGASGYLLKDCAFDELVAAIRAVVAGEPYPPDE